MVRGMGNENFDRKFGNYLNDCRMKKDTKCAIIVTDKQRVISTINEMNFNRFTIDDNSHQNLIEYLEEKIHQNDRSTGWESFKLHDIYVLLKGSKIIINLPLDGNLSVNQAGFLIDILADVCRFNAENIDMISIDIISNDDYKEYCSYDIYKIGKYILSKITEFYITVDEKILETPDQNSVKETSKVYKKS